MKMIYTLSEKISKNVNCKISNVFLFVNVLVWALAALLLAVIVIYTIKGSIAGYSLELFCIAGYSAVFAGFLGGIIYLYRNEQ